MRIPMSCWECTWAEIEAEEAADTAALARGETVPDRRGGRPISPDHWYLADIEEDNAYVETCRNGHSMKMSVQNVRYELLFESGVVATLVGFHRESVSSVVAALERFYEFAIEVFTLRSGVDPAMLDSAWKQLRSSSERQFGAFLLLFLVNLKRPFLAGKPLGTYEEMSNFRNKVIHQGRFPSHEEAMKYARYVFELIRDTHAAVKELDADAVRKVELRHFRLGHQAIEMKAGPPKPGKDGLYRSATSSPMPLMFSSVIKGEPTDFDSRLARSQKNLWLWGFPPQK